jgi:hypothetical protein
MAQEKISAAQSNKHFFGLLDNGQVKEAQDMVTDFTRIRIRESSYFEKAIPSVKIGNDELTPQIGTDKNVKLVEREPGSPAAITIPLGAQPIQYYFYGDRYPVYFDRIATPKFAKDTSELRTYGMDIRQVLSDNAILDMDFELDYKMTLAVDTIVAPNGTADYAATVPETGVVQNKKIIDANGITRNSLAEMFKILPSTFAHLETATVVINLVTVKDIMKFDRLAAGGDLSETFFVDGFQQKKLYGINWVVTIKTELVPNNVMYLFASPEFVGKSYELESTTMYVEKKGPSIEWYAYCERGATIGNPASVARATIATS